VSGPAVTLGGANTSTASFIAPNSAGAQLRFAVKAARTPIAGTPASEIVTSDVVVKVQ
jgi:hypothetical protein